MEKLLRVATRDQVPERGAFAFTFTQEGVAQEGVLVRFKGRVYAYVNQCAHVPLKIDAGTGSFMGPGGGAIRCLNHGALFDPVTGRCLSGPPKGRFLRWLSVREDGTDVLLVVREPAAQADAAQVPAAQGDAGQGPAHAPISAAPESAVSCDRGECPASGPPGVPDGDGNQGGGE